LRYIEDYNPINAIIIIGLIIFGSLILFALTFNQYKLLINKIVEILISISATLTACFFMATEYHLTPSLKSSQGIDLYLIFLLVTSIFLCFKLSLQLLDPIIFLKSKMFPAPSDIAVKVMLRIPKKLHDRIKTSADSGHRTIGSEIVTKLENVYPKEITIADIIAIYRNRIDQAKADENNRPIIKESNDISLRKRTEYIIKIRIPSPGMKMSLLLPFILTHRNEK
jgi:hypothetical protein